jgi:hypothetical protein
MDTFDNQTLLHPFYFAVNSKLAAYKKNIRQFLESPSVSHRSGFEKV